MTSRHHLYCMSAFKQVLDHKTAPTERSYEGQLVFSGPDAAIEIQGSTMRGYIDGAPSHPKGQLAAMIENYDRSILRGARALRRDKSQTVILSGKWHHIDFNAEPRFEAYLVHIVSKDGAVATRRYRSEIFDWDDPGLNNGTGFGYTLSLDVREDAATLNDLMAKRLIEVHRSSKREGELPTLSGIAWFPIRKAQVPIVVSTLDDHTSLTSLASDLENVSPMGRGAAFGDGTVLSALQIRQEYLRRTPGQFRGVQVDRLLHRPAEMTLDEILASTDAAGYWSQTCYGDDEPFSIFNLARSSLPRGDQVLKRVRSGGDPHLLGNDYATDWETASGMSNTRFRLMAVGPAPRLPTTPL